MKYFPTGEFSNDYFFSYSETYDEAIGESSLEDYIIRS